jgi:hypothetical protein
VSQQKDESREGSFAQENAACRACCFKYQTKNKSFSGDCVLRCLKVFT